MRNMRDAFGKCLVRLAAKRQDFVVLDADVAGGTGTYIFRDAYPDRFIQCGIAEQNMMSVAAGISTTGLIPIVTCYAVFGTMRALDQARNSVAYPQFNVKIVVSHLGLDVGPDGPTHQCLEDMSIMRSIPGFAVVSPADPAELNSSFESILDYNGPVYFRTGRSPLPSVYGSEEVRFELGRSQTLRQGTDATIMAVGVMVHRALSAADKLAEEGISARVVNMSSIKPLDVGIIEESARKTGCIVTAEDHNIMGGLGGAVAEVLADICPVPLNRVGVKDRFAESGDPEELSIKYGLMPEDIYVAVKKVIKRKQTC